MARVEITEEEILTALTESRYEGPENAKTVQELSQELSLSKLRILSALKELKQRGRLLTFRVRREDVSGRDQPVPAYAVRKRK